MPLKDQMTGPNRWEAIRRVISGEAPITGTYSTEDDQMRFPSMVPGNTQWLTPVIKMGQHPRLSEEQFQRARDYAVQSGNFKPANEPMSPLGSGVDFFNPSAAQRDDLRALMLKQFLGGR